MGTEGLEEGEGGCLSHPGLAMGTQGFQVSALLSTGREKEPGVGSRLGQ